MMRIIGTILLFTMTLSYTTPALASVASGPDQEIGGSDPDTDPENSVDGYSEIQPDSFINCHKLGKLDGKEVSTSGSTIAGLAGGVLLGLIGTGLVVLFQGESSPSPMFIENLEGDQCQYAYLEAFQEQSKTKKKNAALRGGLIGTVLFIMIYVAVQSQDGSKY